MPSLSGPAAGSLNGHQLLNQLKNILEHEDQPPAGVPVTACWEAKAQTPWYFAAAWRNSNYLKRPESRRIGESFGVAAGEREGLYRMRR